MGTKAPVCSISFHFHLERPFFLNSNALHCTTHTQLDSGAHSPHKAWPLRTLRLVNPNQKLGFLLLAAAPSLRGYNFSLLIGDHIRLEFYGTQRTISATKMVARRFSLLPSHASRRVDRMLNRLAIMPPRASPNIGHEQ
jgi:hypothetical protein